MNFPIGILLTLALNAQPHAVVLAAPTVHAAFLNQYNVEQAAPVPADIELLAVFPRGSWLIENRASGKWRVMKPVACPASVNTDQTSDCFFVADDAWNRTGFCARRIGK